jgi:hypothetical protein
VRSKEEKYSLAVYIMRFDASRKKESNGRLLLQ